MEKFSQVGKTKVEQQDSSEWETPALRFATRYEKSLCHVLKKHWDLDRFVIFTMLSTVQTECSQGPFHLRPFSRWCETRRVESNLAAQCWDRSCLGSDHAEQNTEPGLRAGTPLYDCFRTSALSRGRWHPKGWQQAAGRVCSRGPSASLAPMASTLQDGRRCTQHAAGPCCAPNKSMLVCLFGIFCPTYRFFLRLPADRLWAIPALQAVVVIRESWRQGPCGSLEFVCTLPVTTINCLPRGMLTQGWRSWLLLPDSSPWSISLLF